MKGRERRAKKGIVTYNRPGEEKRERGERRERKPEKLRRTGHEEHSEREKEW